jgi:hypothetical protein
MTVLRFGTDTGCVAPSEGSNLTLVRGGLSQGVTAEGSPEQLALAREASRR